MIYPNIPHPGVTDTSREAAEHIDAKTWMNRVLNAVREKPSTADEIAETLTADITPVRFACKRLHSDGVLTMNGCRLNGFRRHSTIWKLTKAT